MFTAGTMRSWRTDRISFAVVLVCATVTVLPHLIAAFPLPKSEDFEYTTVPSIVLARQVLAGQAPTWVPFVGLGSPWPIPLGIAKTFGLPLMAWLQPLTATALIVWAHLLLMGTSIIALGRRYDISATVLPVCVLSIMFAPALEYLYSADAPTVFLSWTWVPVLFLLVLRLLDASSVVGRLILTGVLGIAAGAAVRVGHPGVIAIYALGFAALALAEIRRSWRALPLLALAAIIAAAAGADQLQFLAREATLFPADLTRQQQGLRGGLGGLIWGSLLRPFFLPVSGEDLLSQWARTNMLIRTVGFGPVFCVVVLLGMRSLWALARARSLLICFVVCLLGALIPVSWLPYVMSATWPLRDFVNMIGVLLAGIALSEYSENAHLRWPILARHAQMWIVVAGAIPLLAGAVFLKDRGIFRSRDYNALVDVRAATPYIEALREAVAAPNEVETRFIATSEASYMMEVEMLVDQGAVNNVAIVHGFSEVSFIAKGVSFDSIQRSQLPPYGTIMGDRIVGLAIVDAPRDWTRDEQALLSVLGIRAVVANADERPLAPDLEAVATLRGRDGFRITVYRNRSALPRSFVVPSDILDQELQRRPGCRNEVLVCFDLAPVHASAAAQGMETAFIENGFRVTAAAAALSRTVLSTFMYRPDWMAVDDRGRTVPVSNWYGLIRFDLPAGVHAVELRYESRSVLNARLIAAWTWGGLLAMLGGSALYRWRRKRDLRAETDRLRIQNRCDDLND